MILDTIDNTQLYLGLHAGFAKAFEILTDKTLSQKQDGKYAIDGEKISAPDHAILTNKRNRHDYKKPH